MYMVNEDAIDVQTYTAREVTTDYDTWHMVRKNKDHAGELSLQFSIAVPG